MEEHECIEKNCVWFEKHEDAPYWRQKESQKRARKAGKAYKKLVAERERTYLERIREATKNDPNFYAINVEQDGCMYVVRIIKFQNLDYGHYLNVLKPLCDGAQLKFNDIKTTVERKKEIIAKHGLNKVGTVPKVSKVTDVEDSLAVKQYPKLLVEEVDENEYDVQTPTLNVIEDNHFSVEENFVKEFEAPEKVLVEAVLEPDNNDVIDDYDALKAKFGAFVRVRISIARWLLKGTPTVLSMNK
jgi:hypothetical protein